MEGEVIMPLALQGAPSIGVPAEVISSFLR